MNEIKDEVKGKTLGYISAALGLVAGLAWNDAISSMIEALFPLSKDTVMVKFLYAGLVTLAVIVLIKSLDKIVNRAESNESSR
ncbi:MAG: DUF5654 family protein [Minisyncoccota bacterium]